MRIGFWIFSILCALPVWGFDKSDLSFMRENNMLERRVMLHTDEWGVKPPKTEVFRAYKGQENSLIDWRELDYNKWLDFNVWKLQRESRDTVAGWREKARDLLHQEFVGKVIQCLNNCRVYTGEGSSPAQFGSKIREGYEFTTEKDSYAWIFLVDGSIVRISPNTSISFLEVNVAKNKLFFSARLNQGHAYFQQRRLGEFPKVDLAETDLAFYPLLVKKANREHYARAEYQKLEPRQKLVYELGKNPGHVSQYEALNELLGQSKEKFQKIETEIFIFTSNAGFTVKNPNFHIFHETTGETWFKAKEKVPGLASVDTRAQEVKVYFRGYKNQKIAGVSHGVWHAMGAQGEMFSPKPRPGGFKMIKQFIRRIPGIHLAREIFLREESKFLWEDWDQKSLALEHGYRLWDAQGAEGELEKRKIFLREYTRRMETTNLKSIGKVFSKPKPAVFGEEYYSEALNRTINALKNLHDYNREVVKETNEAEYYLWIVKHAKDFMPTYLR